MRAVHGCVMYPANRALRAMFIRLHKRYYVGQVRVVLSDTTVDAETSLQQLASAFAMLDEIDARRAVRVNRLIRHVIVWAGDYTAYDAWGGVHLSSRHLSAPAAVLASALVHEATHLRIERRGIRYDPDLRHRIEVLCVREQAAFLRRAGPEGPNWASEVELELEEPWWTEDDRRERTRRSLELADLPSWVEALLYRRQR